MSDAFILAILFANNIVLAIAILFTIRAVASLRETIESMRRRQPEPLSMLRGHRASSVWYDDGRQYGGS